jgi:hypothetical protein
VGLRVSAVVFLLLDQDSTLGQGEGQNFYEVSESLCLSPVLLRKQKRGLGIEHLPSMGETLSFIPKAARKLNNKYVNNKKKKKKKRKAEENHHLSLSQTNELHC